MTPEIKAAIEKEADRLQVLFDDKPSVGMAAQTAAEFGYKLAEERLEIAAIRISKLEQMVQYLLDDPEDAHYAELARKLLNEK